VRLRGILSRQVPGLAPSMVSCQRSGTCRLDTDVVWSDAHRFSDLCTAGRTLPPDEARDALERGFALYGGPLLSSRSTRLYDWIHEDDSAGPSPRRRYHALYCWAVQRLGHLYRREGRTDRAIALYKSLLATEPTLEDVTPRNSRNWGSGTGLSTASWGCSRSSPTAAASSATPADGGSASSRAT